MKYFYDTEFLEGTQKRKVLGFPLGNTEPTIDLISIGIVSEDNREYYAISKEFNLDEAWNRFDKKHTIDGVEKVYWIRENVLKPIYYNWMGKDADFHEIPFTKKLFKKLLAKNGKTRESIKKDIIDFVNPDLLHSTTAYSNADLKEGADTEISKHFDKHNVSESNGIFHANPEFYAYYSAYDHVAFCWLFGKMVDLPVGFPKFSHDLKQMLTDDVKFPKQPKGKHIAIEDAKWNKVLYETIQVPVVRAGNTTRLIDKAIDFLFTNKFIYIPDGKEDFNGLNKEYRACAEQFMDSPYTRASQVEFKNKFVSRLISEHKVRYTTTNNKLFKI